MLSELGTFARSSFTDAEVKVLGLGVVNSLYQ